MYDEGEGVSEDKAEALEWYKKSAKQGLADAQNKIGVKYEPPRLYRRLVYLSQAAMPDRIKLS